MANLKETIANGFAVFVIGFALLMIFGADVIYALIDFARWLGAN